MILKIHRPSEDHQASARALVYSQNYSFVGFMEFSRSLQEMMGDRSKMYAEADVNGEGEIKLIREVCEQNW